MPEVSMAYQRSRADAPVQRAGHPGCRSAPRERRRAPLIIRDTGGLVMRCQKRKTEILITGLGIFFGSSEAPRVIYRIDGGTAVEARWHPSQNGNAVFVPNAIAFMKSLTDNGILFVRAHAFGGTEYDF